jgi:hypothetical protein
MLSAFLVGFGPRGWPLGSKMVELGCQDTDWVGPNDEEVSDGILLRNGLILATLGMDKGKCGYVGCISGWFWAPRVVPRVTDG